VKINAGLYVNSLATFKQSIDPLALYLFQEYSSATIPNNLGSCWLFDDFSFAIRHFISK